MAADANHHGNRISPPLLGTVAKSLLNCSTTVLLHKASMARVNSCIMCGPTTTGQSEGAKLLMVCPRKADDGRHPRHALTASSSPPAVIPPAEALDRCSSGRPSSRLVPRSRTRCVAGRVAASSTSLSCASQDPPRATGRESEPRDSAYWIYYRRRALLERQGVTCSINT